MPAFVIAEAAGRGPSIIPCFVRVADATEKFGIQGFRGIRFHGKIQWPPSILTEHWCLAVIDFVLKEVRYYDSFGRPGSLYVDAAFRFLKDELNRLRSVGVEGLPVNLDEWFRDNRAAMPFQDNGLTTACSLLWLQISSAITLHWIFTGADMAFFRQRVTLNLVRAFGECAK